MSSRLGGRFAAELGEADGGFAQSFDGIFREDAGSVGQSHSGRIAQVNSQCLCLLVLIQWNDDFHNQAVSLRVLTFN